MKLNTILGSLVMVAGLTILGCEEKKYVVVPDEIPAIPVGVYSVTGDGFVEVFWQANNDNGITEGYGVYRYTGTVGGVDEYELLDVVNASPFREIYSYTDSDVDNGFTYFYAINAFNDFGESELSDPDAFDTPRPQGIITFDLTGQPLFRRGYNFEDRARVAWDSPSADVFFEYDVDLDAFFVWAGRDDVYIQSYGYTDNLRDVNWGEPGGGWNNVGWIELSVGHAYIIGMGDVDQDDISEHYAAVRVTELNFVSEDLEIEWAYQTSEFNPELKRIPQDGKFPSAIKYRRSGN